MYSSTFSTLMSLTARTLARTPVIAFALTAALASQGCTNPFEKGANLQITISGAEAASGTIILDAIADASVNENAAITPINAGINALDVTGTGVPIAYTCFYGASTPCSSLPGMMNFNASSGLLTWTPDYTAAGVYNFTIVGSAGLVTGSEIFTITVNNVNQPPVANNITPSSGHTNIQSLITLGYIDAESDLATSCSISALSNVTVTQACACNGAGVCTVGVTSTLNTYGAAGFNYTVIALGGASNAATASFTIKNPFISVWRTTGASETVTLPLRAAYTFNAKINWGDGSPLADITSNADADRIHTYATAGDYTVTISGVFQTLYFSNAGDKLKLRQVTDLGDVGWTSLESAFYGCTNLSTFTGGNVSGVTNMTLMFANASAVNPDTSGWDTSAVTNMTSMFIGAASATLAGANTTNWNTSAVTSMANMFQGATLANPNTTNWNTGAVTSMSQMFYAASNAEPVTTNWNTAAVTSTYLMFYAAAKANPNTSNWNTAAMTNMGGMFQSAILANPNTTNWNTAAVTNMGGLFAGATSATPVTATSGNIWNTANVTSMANMFLNATNANPNTTNWNTAKVTTMQGMFQGAVNAEPITTNWDTGFVTNMQYMFYGATKANPITTNWNTAAVTNMLGMFQNTNFANPTVTNWNTGAVTNMQSMFQSANAANPNVANWNTASVTNMANMFYSNAVATLGAGTRNWNTANVTTMSNMFAYATWANPDTELWNVGKVTTMASMFTWAVHADPQTRNWDVSKVTSMQAMFASAGAGPNPDTELWNVGLVVDMGQMFSGTSRANPNMANWNVSNVVNFASFMNTAYAATPTTDTTNWNTGNVTNMSHMFRDTGAGPNPVVSNWNTSKVTTMAYMFSGASDANPDVSTWDVSKVTDMSYLFANSVANPNLSNWDFGFMTNGVHMFYLNSALTNANYSTMLTRITATSVRTGVTLSAGTAKYTAGAAATARATLVTAGWAITDGGLAP